jgi:cell division protein FtsB
MSSNDVSTSWSFSSWLKSGKKVGEALESEIRRQAQEIKDLQRRNQELSNQVRDLEYKESML